MNDPLESLREPTDLDNVSDEDIATALPDRPPASLFDIAYLYATLDTLARTATVEGVDRSYIQYMTPGERGEVFTQSDADGDHAGNPNVLAVRIVIENGEARLAEEPVVAERFSADDVYRLGYSTVGSKSSHTTVHSVTFHKAGNALDLVDALVNQLDKWTEKDGVMKASKDGYGDVLGPLISLGNDEQAVDDLRDTALMFFGLDTDSIEGDEPTNEELATASDGIIGDKGMFVTLSIQMEGDREWRYPGEVEALNEAMARNRSEKLEEGKSATKGMDAFGEGVCLVRNEEDTVYGGTSTPMATSAGKQWGIFDDMDPASAYRTRPLSRDVAGALSGMQETLDEFRTILGRAQHLYLLPYPESLSVEQARELYAVLDSVRENDEATEVALVPKVTDNTDGLALYAYLLTFENNSVRLPQFESPRIVKTLGRELAEAHVREVGSWLYSDENGPLAIHREGADDDNWIWLYSTDGSVVLANLIRQQYFADTVTRPDKEAENPETITDFPHLDLSFRLFEGESIETQELFDQYVQRCIAYQRDAFEKDWDPTPSLAVAQYLQASALAAINMLDGYAARDHDYDYDMTDRNTRLNSFIESHPALKDEERQSAFLLGGLVGRLSVFQKKNDTSNTLMRRHPVASLTKRNFADVAADVLHLNNVYSETESDGQGIMNRRYTERLMKAGQKTAPSDWSIDRSDLRYHYALGLTYGNADSFIGEDEDEDEPTDD
ncbi:TM1802 family CRISPR-associated protein [Halomontanus rarus]|uniref:TM1802 family CRISPR-associated protein n=1 Tax=Halomontanus rarus TaxID=3034020 RepID=UPI00293BED5F|nr:TM1802 family CRISPR-associated protein [Halovivax sp. KZCA124]